MKAKEKRALAFVQYPWLRYPPPGNFAKIKLPWMTGPENSPRVLSGLPDGNHG